MDMRLKFRENTHSTKRSAAEIILLTGDHYFPSKGCVTFVFRVPPKDKNKTTSKAEEKN